MPNWPQMLFQSWFPKLSKQRQGTEETSHSWLMLLAGTWDGSLLRNGTGTPPLPRSRALQTEEEASTALDFWKRLHKTWGIWDTFQATRVTKEIVSSRITFCVFLNYLENCISTIEYILPTVHIPQSLSQLCCSLPSLQIRPGGK